MSSNDALTRPPVVEFSNQDREPSAPPLPYQDGEARLSLPHDALLLRITRNEEVPPTEVLLGTLNSEPFAGFPTGTVRLAGRRYKDVWEGEEHLYHVRVTYEFHV